MLRSRPCCRSPSRSATRSSIRRTTRRSSQRSRRSGVFRRLSLGAFFRQYWRNGGSMHRSLVRRSLCLSVLVVATACGGGGGSGSGGGTGDRSLQGGDTTSSDRTTLAFENPASNLNAEGEDRHLEGDA